MTIIYRLETVAGVGVYASSASNDIGFDAERHPLPNDDSLLMSNFGAFNITEFNFGFNSLQQLRAWFYKDEWIRILHEGKIVLSVYDAKEAYAGNTQAVFLRSSAKLVSQHNLIEFFKLGV